MNMPAAGCGLIRGLIINELNYKRFFLGPRAPDPINVIRVPPLELVASSTRRRLYDGFAAWHDGEAVHNDK
jgi:hypothetical protein